MSSDCGSEDRGFEPRRSPFYVSIAFSVHSSDWKQRRPGRINPGPLCCSGRPALRALTLRGDNRPWGRELRGAARGVGGRGRRRPSHAHLLGGGEGEYGVARAVGGDGLLPYELLALVTARRVGEELHSEGPVGGAVQSGVYARLERAGLGRAYDGFVLQAVG